MPQLRMPYEPGIGDRDKSISGSIYNDVLKAGSPSSTSDDALTVDHWFSESYRDKYVDQLAFGLYGVLSFNGYWRRAWVLREITLAKKSGVCCGSRLVDFRDREGLLCYVSNAECFQQSD
ncbi:hypothetical protein P171DRAFT_479779 [Karstenula rhodostoma CBS 690.94]|uniref:Heterokaryon incompatibility domain-containing protein n=1 Tax=Karstenula rhodostoma CBS 690.94 TaxID=1392251 RepID=A0A9P4UIJ2_9PLEO|nr:hypothetical protein P171DRAFT_479779 [Karstenula rhodostoma CBS 690.94]